MNLSLNNKIAVVTGGGSGIGKAICKRFASAGAVVHVLDFDTDSGEYAAAEIRENGGDAKFVHADVTDHAAITEKIGKISNLDILVNNAGIAHVGRLDQTSPEDFERLFKVNVAGVYNCLHAAISGMRERKSGVILNMASVASTTGIPDRFAYSMTKGAVMTMTLSVARDYVEDGIRCNCLCPARVHTPFVDNFIKQNYPGEEESTFAKLAASQPIGRMGTPEEIADLALYVCSDAGSFFTGTNIDIDGGFTKLR